MQFLKYSFTLICIILVNFVQAQLGETYDIEKPEKFEERKLGYEKTYTKKYTVPRRFIQNNISHYNFYYNANEKINNVLLRATEAQKDSFDRLLPFYPYNLDFTKAQKQELDSAIQKATGGILLHDLRSNWVDNFYMIIGKSYFLQQKFDSAEMTFNFINYEFAPKDKDKDRLITGSTTEGSKGFSIASNEKKGIVKKITQKPPSRNESLLWLIRTHIENKDFGSAAGLIQTLKNDPVFPKRLYNDLDETTAYFYYTQNIYDSAALYLAKSISLANGKNDKARRDFLTAQLYALANNDNEASKYYSKSVQHTLDPVMEVYARLYSIKLNKGSDPKIIESNINALLKLARKDAYIDYRDIIYYFAGQMELERNGKDAAVTNFLKSAKNATNNIVQKNKTFLALADLAYASKQYQNASNYYDSLNLADNQLKDVESITYKKGILKTLVTLTDIVYVEDSLQRIAAMLPNDRDDYLKKLVKRLRKEQGLKDDGVTFGSTSGGFTSNAPTNLFEPSNGEWYFYNNNTKSRGLNEFKQKWGNRPNVDNWRRSQAIQAAQPVGGRGSSKIEPTENKVIEPSSKKMPKELTIEALTENLPFIEAQVKASNDSIQDALLAIGKLYQFELEDLPNAIETYENTLNRFPNHPKKDDIIYNLYLAYNKIGNTQKASTLKAQINTNNLSKEKLSPKKELTKEINEQANKLYQEIYNLYTAGNLDQAFAKKRSVDSLNTNNDWTPQMLYIEAAYYAKERKDSLAIVALDVIISQYSTSGVYDKAQSLKNALSRRTIIEHELELLKINKTSIDTTKKEVVSATAPVIKNNTPPTTNTSTVKAPITKPVAAITPKPKQDTVKAIVAAPKPIVYPYTNNENEEHYVGIVLNKVENNFASEVKNSLIVYNRTAGRVLIIDNVMLNTDTRIVLLQSFNNAVNAISYATTTQTKAPTEIMPWLAKEKYSFLIISKKNLDILKNTKNIQQYKDYLETIYPGIF
jgi:outer membrane protein assembly factor BamD (BamD/ComL family)